MHICILSSQIAGFGKMGGFGNMTYQLAMALSEAGHQVSVVVPRRPGQKHQELIGKVRIYGVTWRNFWQPGFYRQLNADIYHSQNPNLFSFFAHLAQPLKKHVITCRDPRSVQDWWTEFCFATWSRRFKNLSAYFFEAGPFVHWSISHANVVGVPAHYLEEKVCQLYGRESVLFLPNIEDIPEKLPQKSSQPKVCFVGRLDKRKRPELVFEIARQLPEVEFMMVGKAEDLVRQQELELQAQSCPNIKMIGFLDKFGDISLRKIYEQAWILLNTSVREGLPLTFIEAAAQGCAIVSKVNPDDFATKFGFQVLHDNFVEGIQELLRNDAWKEKGERAYDYVKKEYSRVHAVNIHLQLYQQLLG